MQYSQSLCLLKSYVWCLQLVTAIKGAKLCMFVKVYYNLVIWLNYAPHNAMVQHPRQAKCHLFTSVVFTGMMNTSVCHKCQQFLLFVLCNLPIVRVIVYVVHSKIDRNRRHSKSLSTTQFSSCLFTFAFLLYNI